jgi:hypothetical protein
VAEGDNTAAQMPARIGQQKKTAREFSFLMVFYLKIGNVICQEIKCLNDQPLLEVQSLELH